MTREEKILELIDKRKKGLEIGPSYSPIAPKSQDWNVEIADHLDAKGLREKYAKWSVETSKIEEVDHIVTDRSIAETIGKPGAFDYIIASHVIEHSTDFIAFLQDCQSLLKVGGILSLAVPDMRFCFDVFQSVTTIGMVFQAHVEKRKHHAPGTILDVYANHTMRENDLVWPDRSLDGLHLVHGIVEAQTLTEDYIRRGEFQDAHSWHFTPSSFLLLIHDLKRMGLLDFGVASFYQTAGFEFFVSLKKGYDGAMKDRIEMLRDIANEIRGPGMASPAVSPAPVAPSLPAERSLFRRVMSRLLRPFPRVRCGLKSIGRLLLGG